MRRESRAKLPSEIITTRCDGTLGIRIKEAEKPVHSRCPEIESLGWYKSIRVDVR